MFDSVLIRAARNPGGNRADPRPRRVGHERWHRIRRNPLYRFEQTEPAERPVGLDDICIVPAPGGGERFSGVIRQISGGMEAPRPGPLDCVEKFRNFVLIRRLNDVDRIHEQPSGGCAFGARVVEQDEGRRFAVGNRQARAECHRRRRSAGPIWEPTRAQR